MIDIAVVEDHRMLADGLHAWARGTGEIRVVASAASVEQFLGGMSTPAHVVLLDPTLRAEPDPVRNVSRLLDAGHRVLVVDSSPVPSSLTPLLAAGAHGYLTRDHGLEALAASVRAIASGSTSRALDPAAELAAGAGGNLPRRAPLSEQEYRVLMAYTSGVTLESAARRLGIRPATALTYLKRVKAKYRRAGIPVATKLELAEQVHRDCASGLIQQAGWPADGRVSPSLGTRHPR